MKIKYISGVSKGLVQEIPDEAATELIQGGIAVLVKPTLADFAPERLEEPKPSQKAEAKPVPRPATAEVKPAPKATAYDKLIELVGNHLISSQ